ncbi:MAG: 4Fe-4S binding protein [Clostridia bacterium]|nr:4Fe-4S binding protein [Clostridia bacterium]MBR1685493.1 4Fe-4S binding protein [Clostridia bacterium]MBR2287237.1 4Fe-4S binding protein [Clostridia bacterium]
MVRKIIEIDEAKCNGCGLCATACHEGAIEIVDGKAKLMRENFCDGFGDCLPNCPQGAISFVTREAPSYDAEAVAKAKKEKEHTDMNTPPIHEEFKEIEERLKAHHAGCPGAQMRTLHPEKDSAEETPVAGQVSRLQNWPVQIKLCPVEAPYFARAKLLIAADCTAYAYASFHQEMMRGRVTLIGCPKLDGVDYTDKLREIIERNDIREVTIVRMEVPCCGGLERAATEALRKSGKFLPWQVRVISIDGKILD